MANDSLVADTRVTRLTSNVPAAVAVIEVQGPHAVQLVQQHWVAANGDQELEQNRIRFGVFQSHPEAPDTAAESIVVVRRGPDCVELHCHGGRLAAESILRALVRDGATPSTQSEWMARSFTDPTQAEAMEDLLQAKTPRTAAILLDQWRGALADELRQIDSHRSGGRMEEAHRAAQVLLERSRVGLHLIHPWTVVLCGPPNVGKSSLLNRILGYSRAIVHADAGTTRDLLAEETSIDGWPVMLIDSAGVRASADDIESQGIAKANRAIQSGDRLLLLVDPAQGWTNEHASIWSTHQDRCLVVLTKRDLAGEHAVSMPPSIAPRSVSALSGDGIDTLLNELSRSLVPNPPGSGVAVPFRSRHLQQLEEGLR